MKGYSAYQLKIKKECHKCSTFDPKQKGSFKCALKRSCPGLDPAHKGVKT